MAIDLLKLDGRDYQSPLKFCTNISQMPHKYVRLCGPRPRSRATAVYAYLNEQESARRCEGLVRNGPGTDIRDVVRGANTGGNCAPLPMNKVNSFEAVRGWGSEREFAVLRFRKLPWSKVCRRVEPS